MSTFVIIKNVKSVAKKKLSSVKSTHKITEKNFGQHKKLGYMWKKYACFELVMIIL